jgi:hypothetical protein
MLNRERNQYFPSSVSSLTFNEQQRISPPELQVRRLSQQDWLDTTAYPLHSVLSASLSSSASIESNHYEL